MNDFDATDDGRMDTIYHNVDGSGVDKNMCGTGRHAIVETTDQLSDRAGWLRSCRPSRW